MRRFALVIATAGLAGCAMAPQQDERGAAQRQLAQMLAGKVAGPTMECIPEYHAGARSLVTPQAIAFEPNPGRIYVSSTAGTGCEGVAGERYSIVATSPGSRLCAGDQIQVRDLQTGVMSGACALTPFVPYSRP